MNTTTKQVILITGASSGFGALAARTLARAGHIAYASMRGTTGRNAPQVEAVQQYAAEHKVDLRTVELDVASQESADAAIQQIVAELYDINVLSTQRVNRAALPQLRQQGRGLLVWVSSSSARGGTPPYLSPYFAAKAAMDSVAVSYASELTRWGIETSIVVPGAFTKGTNHFVHSGKPADQARADEYHNGPYAGLPEQSLKGLANLEPADADVGEVATAIARIIDTPFGKRPFRIHIDPSQDGAEIVNGVADRVRSEMFRRIGLEDLLHPAVTERSKA